VRTMRRPPTLYKWNGRTTGPFLHSGKNCQRQAADPQQCAAEATEASNDTRR